MFLSTAAVLLSLMQATTDNFGYDVTSVAYTSGQTLADAGLLTSDTSTSSAAVTLTNDATHTSTSATASATFTIYWSPSYSGQTPPSSVTVTANRWCSFTVSGNGVCSVLDTSQNAIDTQDGSQGYFNGMSACEPDFTATIPMTSQPDGTSKGLLVVPTWTLRSTYDSDDNAATSVTEAIAVSNYSIPQPTSSRLPRKEKRCAK